MTADEFFEWATAYEIKPFEENDDIRFANLNATVACKVFKDAKFDEMYKAFLPKRRAKDVKDAIQPREMTMDRVISVLAGTGMTKLTGVRPPTPED